MDRNDHDRADEFAELREIADRLRESRAEFTALELDDLHGRLRRRVARRPRRTPLLRRLRANSLVGVICAALLLTTGGGVVLAEGALGGGHTKGFGDPFGNSFQNTFHDTSLRHDRDASSCQYGPRVYTFTYPTRFGALVVIVTVYCGQVSVNVIFVPYHHFRFDPGQWQYHWNGGGLGNHNYGWNGSGFDTTAPSNGPSSMNITAGGQTFTVPLNQ